MRSTGKQLETVVSKDDSEEEEEVDDEEFTCCHRLTLCSPFIRNMMITQPVFKGIGRLAHPTWEQVFWFSTNAGMAIIVWGILFFLLGETMLPNHEGFGLYFLVICSYLFGISLSAIPYLHLPPVFGMLLAGVIVRNTGIYNIHKGLGSTIIGKIRTFCLTFIMIRTGLQLSTTSLAKNSVFLLFLAILPCTFEMLVITLCCNIVLQYPWDWSFLAGSILSCMSPVVTVNCVIALAERGYGEDKGIATILCTAACIEVVHVISMIAISYSILFSNDKGRTEWWSYIPGGLRDAMLGLLAGIVLGIFLVFFPHRSYKYAMWYRVFGLVCASVMCTMATAKMTVSGGGYLAAVVLSFIAITGWRILSAKFDTTPFRRAAFILWQWVQPILVGVISCDIDFDDWSASRFALHLVCIAIGLVARGLITFLISLKSHFSWKERLFVTLSWLPKGAIQAGFGPIAYERVLRNKGDQLSHELARDIIRVSVVTVLFLAPIGATLINLTGPLLLNQISEEDQHRERELSYLRILSLHPIPKGIGGKKIRLPNIVNA